MGFFIVIGMFLLLPSLIVGLLIFLETKRKSRVRKRLQKAVDQLSRQHDLLIEKPDYFQDRVIGIDKRRKKLVFAHFKKGLVDQLYVDLKLVVSCMLSTKIDQKLKQITHVFLQLHLRHQSETIRLDFYTTSLDSRRTQGELYEKARHWKDQINFNRRLEKPELHHEFVL